MIIALIFTVITCEKDNDSAFSGITEQDYTGDRVGNVDRTDWKFDDVWNNREEALFNPGNFASAKNATDSTDNPPGVGFITQSRAVAYPNPAKVSLIFHIESSADTIMFVLVDGGYHIIASGRHAGGSGSWDFAVSNRKKFKVTSFYRIYYKLEHTDGIPERGHGDFKVII